ncbi:MAG: hypothetical protein QW689_08960 [Nitrososphaerota archaeon]
MSEVETEERVFRVPLQFIKPLPFNTTAIGTKEEEMLYGEMKRPDGPEKIDPIILRDLHLRRSMSAKMRTHGSSTR